jgi:hypothetical protein
MYMNRVDVLVGILGILVVVAALGAVVGNHWIYWVGERDVEIVVTVLSRP